MRRSAPRRPRGPLFFSLGLQAVFRSPKEELQNPSTFDMILTQVPDAHQAAHRLTDWDHETEQAILPLAALLDDIRFVGPWPVVAFAAVRLRELLGTLPTGLRYNVSKCAAWSPKFDNTNLFSDLESDRDRVQLPSDGITLLGSPIGTAQFERSTVTAKVEAHSRLLDRIAQLPSLQLALLLLRYCAAQRFT